MIEAREIIKNYGIRTVLDGASMTVSPGECVVLTGDNGSGKTTLLHVMMGLRRADGGEVCWRDRTLAGADRGAWRKAREAWGFMPQRLDLPPAATVDELLRFHARLRRRELATARSWLERAGLADTELRRVAELSGGMRQRLAIVLTLFFEPELIVMDEPASNLDPGWREALAGWATEQSQRGAGMLVTSQLDESWGPATVRRHCTAGRIVDWPVPHEPRPDGPQAGGHGEEAPG